MPVKDIGGKMTTLLALPPEQGGFANDPILGLVDYLGLHGVTLHALQYYVGILAATILFIATISVVLAVILPGQSGENRNKAATALLCAGNVDVGLSLCNEGCSLDTHCVTGLICYKSGTATDGVCRNPLIPSVPTCQTPAPSMSPTPTPTKVGGPSGSPVMCMIPEYAWAMKSKLVLCRNGPV